MSAEISCARHGKRVCLRDKDTVIVHADGSGHCSSNTFTTRELARQQVMALLLVEEGMRFLGDGREERTERS